MVFIECINGRSRVEPGKDDPINYRGIVPGRISFEINRVTATVIICYHPGIGRGIGKPYAIIEAVAYLNELPLAIDKLKQALCAVRGFDETLGRRHDCHARIKRLSGLRKPEKLGANIYDAKH